LAAFFAGGSWCPGRFQSVAEITYEFVGQHDPQHGRPPEGMKVLSPPDLLACFLFLVSTLVGIIPLHLTVFRSHIIVTAAPGRFLCFFIVPDPYGPLPRRLRFFKISCRPAFPISFLPLVISLTSCRFVACRPVFRTQRVTPVSHKPNVAGHSGAANVFAGFVAMLPASRSGRERLAFGRGAAAGRSPSRLTAP